jgi:hypothetical protein
MRPRLALVLLIASASSANALEKTLARFPEEDAWSSTGASCSLAYFNICTGWVWVWSGWDSEERVGVVFDPCCSHAVLEAASVYVLYGAPPGYGFTGVINVQEADAEGCPVGPPLVGAFFLPTHGGWYELRTNLPVQGRFLVSVMCGALTAEVGFASDRPAAGPTGPAACGFCYPVDRPTHSATYGRLGSPLCPGLPLYDGVCNAELLWTASLRCDAAFALESRSWSSIKGLYK